MNISQDIINQIKDHQSEFPDKEVVGFIIQDDKCWPMVNIAENPDTFCLDPTESKNVFSLMAPKAMYHTHLNEGVEASNFDLNCIDYSQLPMVIVNNKGEFSTYLPE